MRKRNIVMGLLVMMLCIFAGNVSSCPIAPDNPVEAVSFSTNIDQSIDQVITIEKIDGDFAILDVGDPYPDAPTEKGVYNPSNFVAGESFTNTLYRRTFRQSYDNQAIKNLNANRSIFNLEPDCLNIRYSKHEFAKKSGFGLRYPLPQLSGEISDSDLPRYNKPKA